MVFDPTANASNATGFEDEVQGDDEGLSTLILVGTGVGLLFLVAGVVLMLEVAMTVRWSCPPPLPRSLNQQSKRVRQAGARSG